MSDDGYDPRHPHEPEIPPVVDDKGRCLVCGLIVRAESSELVVARLGEACAEYQAEVKALRIACDRWRERALDCEGWRANAIDQLRADLALSSEPQREEQK